MAWDAADALVAHARKRRERSDRQGPLPMIFLRYRHVVHPDADLFQRRVRIGTNSADRLLHRLDVNSLWVWLAPAQPLVRKEDKYFAARRRVANFGHQVVNESLLSAQVSAQN